MKRIREERLNDRGGASERYLIDHLRTIRPENSVRRKTELLQYRGLKDRKREKERQGIEKEGYERKK
jgi:hypothetical protein